MKELNKASVYMMHISDVIFSSIKNQNWYENGKNVPKHLIQELKVNRVKIIEQLFRRHLQIDGGVTIGFDRGDCDSFNVWLIKNKDLLVAESKRNKDIYLDPQSKKVIGALFMLYQANTHLLMLDRLLEDFQDFVKKHQLTTETQLRFLNKYILRQLPQSETNPRLYDIYKNKIIEQSTEISQEITEAQVLEKIMQLRKEITDKSKDNIINALSLVITPLEKNQAADLLRTWESVRSQPHQSLTATDLQASSAEEFNFVEMRGLVDQIAFNNAEKMDAKKDRDIKLVKEVAPHQVSATTKIADTPRGAG